jgi:hypothetical protein
LPKLSRIVFTVEENFLVNFVARKKEIKMVNIELVDGTFVWCDDLPVDRYCTLIEMYYHDKEKKKTYFFGLSGEMVFSPQEENWIEATKEERKFMGDINPVNTKLVGVKRIIIQ